MALQRGRAFTPVGPTLKVTAIFGNDNARLSDDRYRFCATLQLRTPLRVLRHHGDVHPSISTEPPEIARAMWEGMWVPITPTWREIGIDVNELEPIVASDIGPLPDYGRDYLKFLIAVRSAAEGEGSVEERRSATQQVLMDGQWRTIVSAHGGEEEILRRLCARCPSEPRR